MDKLITAFGYARKSPDDKEGTGVSINNQIKLIEQYCKDNSWSLSDIYIDKNISGSDRNRKGFNDMKTKAISIKKEHPELDIYLITKDQDRFCRDSAFFSDTLQDLNAYGIKVFSILKNGFLSHEDLADMVTSIVDANVIVKSRIKALSILESKKKEGLPSIKAPFGYKYKDSVWVADKRKADIVKDILNSFLNKENFKESIKRNKISVALYYRIINNLKKGLYSGYIVYNRKIRDSGKNIVRTEEVRYRGNHEPLINEQMFNRVNQNG